MDYDKDPYKEQNLRDYGILGSVSLACGLTSFDFNWWLLLKLPFLVSGVVLLYAIFLYMIRK